MPLKKKKLCLFFYYRKTRVAPSWVCCSVYDSPAGPWPRLYQTTRIRSAQRHQRVSTGSLLLLLWWFQPKKRGGKQNWLRQCKCACARTCRCLWFMLEVLMTKNENNSHAFLRKMVENIKLTKDAQCPDDAKANEVNAPFAWVLQKTPAPVSVPFDMIVLI